MCDLDGDGYVDKKTFSMIKREIKFNSISKAIGKMNDKISRQELIDKIESNDFIKELKPFNLADYFKSYERLVDIQSNGVGNMAKILRAYEDKEKIKEDVKKYINIG